jgi:AraC family transcriptional regulator, L-arginine-responsive activator
MLDKINLKNRYRIFSAPRTEVEHRTAHNADHAVLNLFETRREAFHFDLLFENPVVVSMIQGRKQMHLRQSQPFDFLPGQTLVMPPDERMAIDFPDATHHEPTQCLALEISPGFVRQTLEWLNEHFPRLDDEQWSWSGDNMVLRNQPFVQDSLNRLIRVMVQNSYSRELLAVNTTRELIAGLMQTQARHLLLQHIEVLHTRKRLAHVVQYIRENLHRPLTVNELARQACLSRAQFFRAFQRELGETPVQFINRERLERARSRMRQGLSVTQACLESGFQSLTYFSRVFRQVEGISPSAWKAAHSAGRS